MDKQLFSDLPVDLNPSDLAKALRAVQVGGNVMQMPNSSALVQGRLGYEFPLNDQSQLVAGVSGQKAINACNPFFSAAIRVEPEPPK